MVVLKKSWKLMASSLIETITATVIIVLVFGMSSLTLLNVFRQHINNKKISREARIHELHYRYLNNRLTLPYEETWEEGTLQLTRDEDHISLIIHKNADSGQIEMEKRQWQK